MWKYIDSKDIKKGQWIRVLKPNKTYRYFIPLENSHYESSPTGSWGTHVATVLWDNGEEEKDYRLWEGGYEINEAKWKEREKE